MPHRKASEEEFTDKLQLLLHPQRGIVNISTTASLTGSTKAINVSVINKITHDCSGVTVNCPSELKQVTVC